MKSYNYDKVIIGKEALCLKVSFAFFSATKSFTPLQLKFALLVLFYNFLELSEINTEMLQGVFGEKANVHDIIKRTLQKSTNDPGLLMKSPSLFKTFYYEVRWHVGQIMFSFKNEILEDTNTVELQLKQVLIFPNTGLSLRLYLFLLFALKNKQFTFSVGSLATQLFGGRRGFDPKYSRNAVANQKSTLLKTLSYINSLTRPFPPVTIQPVKKGKKIIEWTFNIPAQRLIKPANPDTITQLFHTNGFNNVPAKYVSFIAKFITESEAQQFMNNICKTASILIHEGIIDDNECWIFLARQSVLYPHTTPKLWYTVPRVQAILEQHMYNHPASFMQDISIFITKCSNYKELIKYIKEIKQEDSH